MTTILLGQWLRSLAGDDNLWVGKKYLRSALAAIAPTAAALALLAITAPPALADDTPAQPAPWTRTLEAELRFADWTGSRGDGTSNPAHGSGNEIYLPLSLSLSGTEGDFRIDTMARAGFVFAHQGTSGSSGSYDTATDTILTATVTDTALTGFQPFVSANFNLPTGSAAIFGPAAFARMDPDIVDVPAFGEGFNFGATFGANIPLRDNLVATLSAGLTLRDPFSRETPFNPPFPQTLLHMGPGNVASIDASLAWQGTEWYLSGDFTWMTSGTVRADGVSLVRPGDSFSSSFSAYWQIDPAWTATASLSWSYGLKNQVDLGGGILGPEVNNSNSNLFSLDLTPNYTFGSWNVGPHASFLYRDSNSYQVVEAQFSPAKTRIALGARGGVALSDTARLDLSLDHIWTNERDMQFPSGIPVVSKNAWTASLATSISF